VRLPSLLARHVPPATLGRLGERRAAWFYRLRGYTIVERNVKLPSGEIDLIVRRGTTTVLAEVKTRQSLSAGEGHQAVDRRKRERLIRLAAQYAARHPDVHLRFDILSLHWTGWRFLVDHYPDAFRPVADPHYPWIWRG
jgi:putative endonuclease